jgi:AcrR family transcriptional regulator
MQMTLQEEIRSLKRERILAVASKLFFEKGYVGTSIDSICAVLGVTKPFVYYHFAKKDDILLALYQDSIDAAIETIQKAKAGTTDPVEQFKRFVRAYSHLVLTDRERIALTAREKGLLSRAVMKDVYASRHAFHDSLISMLKACANAGKFQISDPSLTAYSVIGVMTWTIHWYKPQGRLSTDEIISHMLEATLRVVGYDETAGRGVTHLGTRRAANQT